MIRALAHQKPRVVEKVLMLLRLQIDKRFQRLGRSRAEVEEGFMQMKEANHGIKDTPHVENKDSSK